MNTRQQAAELYWQLKLEVQDIEADIAYAGATSFCDDCPARSWHKDSVTRIADHCCKDEPDYNARLYQHIAACKVLMAKLAAFATPEELKAAQERLGDRKAGRG